MMKPKYWTGFGRGLMGSYSSHAGLVFANLWCLANAAMTIVMPIVTMIITYRYNKIIKTDSTYKKKYRFIFGDIKADKQPAHLMIILFIMRRYLLVVCLVAFPKNWFF